MRATIPWLLGASLLTAATAAIAQKPLPCASISEEVREYVRARGACRDIKPASRPRASARPAARAAADRKSAPTKQAAPPQEVAPPVVAPPVIAPPAVAATDSAPGPQAAEVVAGSSPADAPPADEPAIPAAPPATASSADIAAATTTAPGAPIPAAADPPVARDALPDEGTPNVALIFGAGASIGLLLGAFTMREWLLRRQEPAGRHDFAATLLQDMQADEPLRDAPSPDIPPPDAPMPGQQQPAALPSAAPAAAASKPAASEVVTTDDITFAAWLVPLESTLQPAPRQGGIPIEWSRDCVSAPIRLHTPVEVSGADIERALVEQCKSEPAVAQAFDQLRGTPALRAAEAVNRALAVDMADLLARGWIQVPAVHRAVQLSALTRTPSTLVSVDRHRVAAALRVVLETMLPVGALPPLEMSLDIVADVREATVGTQDGRIELVALGDTAVLARLEYRGVLVATHATGIAGAPRDAFETQPQAPARDRPASIDFPL